MSKKKTEYNFITVPGADGKEPTLMQVKKKKKKGGLSATAIEAALNEIRREKYLKKDAGKKHD